MAFVFYFFAVCASEHYCCGLEGDAHTVPGFKKILECG